MQKLELFYFDACPFCQLVLREITKLGLEDKIDFKDIVQDPALRQMHIQKTGRATTPCLYIDGEPMFESSDIVDWLRENKDLILS